MSRPEQIEAHMRYPYTTIHKIGGRCLRSELDYQQVKELMADEPQLIVVSAIGKTTAKLQQLLNLAQAGHAYHELLLALEQQHAALASELLADSQSFQTLLRQDIEQLAAILACVSALRHADPFTNDYVLAFGETWSAQLLSRYLGMDCALLNATDVLIVEKEASRLQIDWHTTKARLNAWLENNAHHQVVITGFIAADKKGRVVTLGLEGSDYSASIFGQLFAVPSVTIWTDVGGIHTADPNRLPQAKVIPELSYEEAIELAYFGASVIHPAAMQPAMMSGIPILIKNLHQPFAAGSLICKYPKPSETPIRGVTALEQITLINIANTNDVAVSDLATKVFDTLSRHQIEVLLISHASALYSLCFAVRTDMYEKTLAVLDKGLGISEGAANCVITSKKNCSILSIVGEAMVGQAGNSAKLLSSLAKANINVAAISQGSSERSISVIIAQDDLEKARSVVHAGFGLSKSQLQIALIGPGNVGQVFLQQLLDNRERLGNTLGVELNITAIASSQKMLVSDLPLIDCSCLTQIKEGGVALNLTHLLTHLKKLDTSHTVIIDCTASESVVDNYPLFIEHGFHIITPNKKATSGELGRFQFLQKKLADKKRHFLYETNVCAGLPVIKTLQDLVATGDQVHSIEGVFSGTLSYLFNELSQGKLFSSVLLAAYDQGLTEPDPRDDLSGMDVARKCVCLARELGFKVSLEQVEIEPLLPPELMVGTLTEFLAKTKEMDGLYIPRVQRVLEQGKKLVYCGRIDVAGHLKLSLEVVSQASPFFNLKGTDNMVIFRTDRYSDHPLVVQGPGAGAEVTAAGVFADLLRLVALTSSE